MTNKINVQAYLDMINAPWGQLFYKLIWHNMEFEGKRILDFGSGFGLTANYLAKNNRVIALEPSHEMVEHRFMDYPYEQMVGGIELLESFADASFDVIVCHNVFEYVDNREEILAVFYRLLKPGGVISLVKHHKAGKIMQKVVFENRVDEALSLLEGGDALSASFGVIDEYEESDLLGYCNGWFVIEDKYGVRMFFGLQCNEFKTEADWLDKMFEMEMAAQSIPTFRDIAFFQHLILKNRAKKRTKI